MQELAPGKSLADSVTEGWLLDEAEVTRIACEMLDLLKYLGSRSPPVLHRQVRLEACMCTAASAPDRCMPCC